ncbi:hypothetical protein GQ602_003347 [Ophiocordyceps camponoti-floridani]|uniref:Uncharacterized protein n=1 Tax=Ophiocordyceps camponoti-floridani TaxID=2030778 RepID=A0A8H4Q856_9HYPO|nr:hypothetical protein GQ602_003347 [Ophiocordyceps camponoti-floridani]
MYIASEPPFSALCRYRIRLVAAYQILSTTRLNESTEDLFSGYLAKTSEGEELSRRAICGGPHIRLDINT